MADFDINAHLQRMGFGQGGGGAPDPNAKPTDLSDFINKLFEKLGDWVTKATGVNVTSFFNTGMFANAKIEQAGIQVNNQIMKQGLLPDAPGGALAQIATQVFNNKFDGVSAPPIGEGSYGSSSSGGDSGGGGGGFADYNAISGISAPAISGGFEGMHIPVTALMSLVPSTTPSMGPSQGAGMEM
ncbi:MAG: hypothetical protein SFT92_05395 [Rickettsiales bacterium]|nr:hypothetical protein [Rickettsiales bacterium]